MKIIRCAVIGFCLFSVVFSLFFFLSDKKKDYTVEYCVEEPLVYTTEHGTCYHASDCHYLNQSKIEKGLYNAQQKGYRPCSYCKGIPYGTIQVNYYKTEEKDITCEVAIRSFVFSFVACASVCVWGYTLQKKRWKNFLYF